MNRVKAHSSYAYCDEEYDGEQFKEEDEEADRGNDGKTTSKSGLALNGTSCYGKLRTVRSGGSWL